MIADRNLCLGDLIGVIKTFFHKIGITQVWVTLAGGRGREGGVRVASHDFCTVGCCFVRCKSVIKS